MEVDERREPATADEREWLRVRRHLAEQRYELSVAASEQLYRDVRRVAGTPLLAADTWLPPEPLPLDHITLELDPNAAATFAEPATPRYSELVGRFARPAVFENRPTYRLLAADLRSDPPIIRFGMGEYFDGMDTGEAVAHEYAALSLGLASELNRRAALGSPVDPGCRPTNVAISAVTIRHDRDAGTARFLLHWRDPAKVGHAGGLFQVIPVGIFQQASNHRESVRNDFSLWRCLIREYAEELLGEAETSTDAGPIDYAAWPFAAELTRERDRGGVRAHCLGMGVDPLTLATDLLCAVVIEASVFDSLFGGLVSRNTEGALAQPADGLPGVPFVADEVERLTTQERMQAAGAAALALAWSQRRALVPGPI